MYLVILHFRLDLKVWSSSFSSSSSWWWRYSNRQKFKTSNSSQINCATLQLSPECRPNWAEKAKTLWPVRNYEVHHSFFSKTAKPILFFQLMQNLPHRIFRLSSTNNPARFFWNDACKPYCKLQTANCRCINRPHTLWRHHLLSSASDWQTLIFLLWPIINHHTSSHSEEEQGGTFHRHPHKRQLTYLTLQVSFKETQMLLLMWIFPLSLLDLLGLVTLGLINPANSRGKSTSTT